MQRDQEKKLEEKYMDVLCYSEAKSVLETGPYTAGQIRGALTRYYRKEETTPPQTFQEMEQEFLPDFIDWWLDADSALHTDIGESVALESAARYLAFTTVWKAKVKNNSVVAPVLNLNARTMIAVKNALAHAMKATFSYAKRNPVASIENLSKAFPQVYANILPFTFAIQDGTVDELPAELMREDLSRLVGAYLAGDTAVVNAAKNIRLIEQDAA